MDNIMDNITNNITNINYQTKYLKYKNKYSNLVKKINQVGGAFPFIYGDCEILYIMAKIEGDTLDRINERRTAFGLQPKGDLHISLLQLYINNKHPNYSIFESKEFKDTLVASYKNNIIANNIQLQSKEISVSGNKRGLWEFLGRDPHKFWARVYILNSDHKQYISQFRRNIYNFINQQLGQSVSKTEQKGIGSDQEDFEIYSYNGQELYAINKKFYFGIDNWKPHISVLTISELEQSQDKSISQKDDPNSVMYKFSHSNSDDRKIDVLRLEVSKRNKTNPISNIDLNKDIKQIKFSLNNPKTKTNKEEYLTVNQNIVDQNAGCSIM